MPDPSNINPEALIEDSWAVRQQMQPVTDNYTKRQVNLVNGIYSVEYPVPSPVKTLWKKNIDRTPNPGLQSLRILDTLPVQPILMTLWLKTTLYVQLKVAAKLSCLLSSLIIPKIRFSLPVPSQVSWKTSTISVTINRNSGVKKVVSLGKNCCFHHYGWFGTLPERCFGYFSHYGYLPRRYYEKGY